MPVTLAQRKQGSVRPKTVIKSIPPPVGGWNTIDALTAMPPEDAVFLDNWYPDQSRVRLRKGRLTHADTLSATNVDTLIPYDGDSGIKLLAASNGEIFDVTDGAAVVSISSGHTSDGWQFASLSNFTQLVNGQDEPLKYDGSVITTTSWTGTDLTNPELFIGVIQYRNRLYFWKDEGAFWYSEVGAIQGNLRFFDIAQVARRGGRILAMATLSRDAGNGPDDFLCIFMTTGEILQYAGSNPNDATNWFLAGSWMAPPMVSIRSAIEIAGDVMMITTSDYFFLTELMFRDPKTDPFPKSKVGPALRVGVDAAADEFGWTGVFFPDEGMVIFNVNQQSSEVHQHVLNLKGTAWCRYFNHKARCWAYHDKKVFFGTTDGIVKQAETGFTDDGAIIAADGQSAHTAFGALGRKRASALRAIMRGVGPFEYSIGIGFDYEDAPLTAPTSADPAGTPWGSPWGSPWSGEAQIDIAWRAANGSGDSASVRVKLSGLQKIEWLRTDLRLEPGHGL